MFRDSAGDPVSKEVLLDRLKDHITTVVKRYKGKIYAWDVVNEAIDDRRDVYLRETQWYKIGGEDIIAAAFIYAHAADPEAALYYNDYNSEDPVKRDKISKLVKSLIDKKVPVHGIGLQGHWKLKTPSAALIRQALDSYTALGLKCQITELDISVRDRVRPGMPPDTVSAYTNEMADKQAERYREVFRIFREYQKHITNVTFWNVSDRHSWLDGRDGGLAGGAQATLAPGERPPLRSRVIKAYPLLFGVELERKKVYSAVADLK